jgi:hypothetical protein
MTRDELMLRLALVVSADELQRLRRDLDEQTEEAPRWLRDVARAADTLPLPPVPPVLASSLRRMFDGPVVPEIVDGRLVHDSRVRELVGVRADGETTGWSLS